MGRWFTVASDAFPAVEDYLVLAKVDHWLDSDAETVFDKVSGAGATEVGHLGVFVKAMTDSVTTHFAHYRITAGFAVFLDSSGNVSDAFSFDSGFDADIERFRGGAKEREGFGSDVAYGECVARVAVEAVEHGTTIN